jgi:hypothetical protein
MSAFITEKAGYSGGAPQSLRDRPKSASDKLDLRLFRHPLGSSRSETAGYSGDHRATADFFDTLVPVGCFSPVSLVDHFHCSFIGRCSFTVKT